MCSGSGVGDGRELTVRDGGRGRERERERDIETGSNIPSDD